jgi:hypothetical protein
MARVTRRRAGRYERGKRQPGWADGAGPKHPVCPHVPSRSPGPTAMRGSDLKHATNDAHQPTQIFSRSRRPVKSPWTALGGQRKQRERARLADNLPADPHSPRHRGELRAEPERARGRKRHLFTQTARESRHSADVAFLVTMNSPTRPVESTTMNTPMPLGQIVESIASGTEMAIGGPVPGQSRIQGKPPSPGRPTRAVSSVNRHNACERQS